MLEQDFRRDVRTGGRVRDTDGGGVNRSKTGSASGAGRLTERPDSDVQEKER